MQRMSGSSPGLSEHYIMVLVVDGQYGGQTRVGLTMPLVTILQSKGLTLEGSLWNMRCPATSTSLSLCWYSGGEKVQRIKKQNSRKQRTMVAVLSQDDGKSSVAAITPVNAPGLSASPSPDTPVSKAVKENTAGEHQQMCCREM